jgi:hypothetical protein
MTAVTVADALVAFGRSSGDPPGHPVLHGSAGTLVTYGLPDAMGALHWVGVWISDGEVRFLGGAPVPTGAAAAHGLKGASAGLFELLVAASRTFLERIEEIDENLAETQEKGRSVPLSEIWRLQRRVAIIRAQIGRSIVGFTECTRFPEVFPGLTEAAPAVDAELTRVQQLAESVRQALSDLILLRNAEESNRIADAANQLSKTSNRIAALANTSNIRMLGLTYVALVLGLVSAVVLIPNTGATILGMPSAAWVPGYWVDVILVVLALVPLVLVFSRRWVLAMLRGIRGYETRVTEGIQDLPELESDGTPERPRSRGTG